MTPPQALNEYMYMSVCFDLWAPAVLQCRAVVLLAALSGTRWKEKQGGDVSVELSFWGFSAVVSRAEGEMR